MTKTALMAAALMLAMGLAACSGTASETTAAETQTEAQTEAAAETTEAAEESTEAQTESEAESSADTEAKAELQYGDVTVRVGSLKGPTTMGLVNMMEWAEDGELPFKAEFTMATAADEITAKLVNGDLDIALVPANLASVLYNKTEGGISVIDINTLGVLYGVTGDESVSSLADLAGKTIYMTGQGTTPQYAMDYILAQNGLTDSVTIEYRSEATEIAALFAEDPTITAVLPQPFATVVQVQNEGVTEFMDLNEEWDKCPDSGDSMLLTGVTIASRTFLDEHAEDGLVDAFISTQRLSTEAVSQDTAHTAELVVEAGIIEKAPIAEKAIPKCGIACITGEEMKGALSGYLDVLFNANAQSVGGSLPGDDFYWMAE